jgi:hypothetical protein
MAQLGHTDPTLTLRIYQPLLKRRRREEYRGRVNALLGTSPVATAAAHDGPNSGPNALSYSAGAARRPSDVADLRVFPGSRRGNSNP